MLETSDMDFIIADSGNIQRLSEFKFKEGKLPDLINIGLIETSGDGTGPDNYYELLHQELSGEFLWGSGNSKSAADPDDTIYIYFTSGTTGTPRAMEGINRSLAHFIDWEVNRFDVDETSRFSQLTTPVFDAFLRDVYVPLCAGGMICIPDNREVIQDPDSLYRWIEDSRISYIHCVPGILRSLIPVENSMENRFSHLKYILLSGEPLRPSDVEAWYSGNGGSVQLVNLWGTSETTLAKTCHLVQPDDSRRERVSVGQPFPGSRVLVLDGNMELCDRLVTGELYIKTPYRTRGYYGSPELTAQRFIPDPFDRFLGDSGRTDFSGKPIALHKTGDIGRILIDGSIDVLGRNDRQVKIRGIRVELAEIESLLTDHPDISEAVVIKREFSGDSGTANEILSAFVILTKSLPESDAEMNSRIKDFLARHLPSYMVPADIVFLKTMPRKPGGKIDYDALPALMQAEESTIMEPRDEVEAILVRLWQSILGIDSISVNRGFFDSGGNSLNIMALISRIHKELDVRLSLGDMFNNPTIEKQARLIRAAAPERFIEIPPVELKDFYPLSPAQKRLYMLFRMEPASIAYNMSQAVRINGVKARNQIERAFSALIRRHESLRTSFCMIDGIPVQRIHPHVPFAVEYFDPSPDIPEVINTFIRPFDLSTAPLIRVGIIEEGEGTGVLMADMHHVISDGVSRELLIREFGLLFDGKEAIPTELRIQYKDFAVWQTSLLNSTDINHNRKDRKTFWMEQLDGEIPVLNLPCDLPRPSVQSFEGSTFRMKLDGTVSADLRNLAVEENVSLFILIVSMFSLLMSRLSGQEDIIVGSPLAGRNHADLHHIIGMFVNTIVIRSYPTGTNTFESYLQQVRETTLAVFGNQDYPFEELVEQLNLPRNLGRNPLFDVAVTMQNNQLENRDRLPEDPGPQVSQVEFRENVSKFDMTLHSLDNPSGIFLVFEYCTRLFKEESIQRFSRYWAKHCSRSDCQSQNKAPRYRNDR